jgi:hypothetical protein
MTQKNVNTFQKHNTDRKGYIMQWLYCWKKNTVRHIICIIQVEGVLSYPFVIHYIRTFQNVSVTDIIQEYIKR